MEKENKIMKLGFIGTGNMAGAIKKSRRKV